jgi:hypothetical protein
MKNLPQGFVSTLLAQKKLSGNGKSNNSNNATISDDYSFNPRLSDKPSFHTPNIRDNKDFGMPIAYVVATLARKAKSVYERYLVSEEGKQLLLKAHEYEIPYDMANIDILTLRDKVEEFEEVIQRANEYGINWKSFGYDILAIEQEMFDIDQAESNYLNYAKTQFAFARRLEA